MSTYLSHPYLYDEERYFVSNRVQNNSHETQQNTLISSNTVVNVEQEKKIVELEKEIKLLQEKIALLNVSAEILSGLTALPEQVIKLEEVTNALQEDVNVLNARIQIDENGTQFFIADDVRLLKKSAIDLYPEDSTHEQVTLTQDMTYTNVIEKLAKAIYDLNDISDGDEFV